MINHDIMRLNISVHYTHTVTVVKSLTTQNKNKQVNNYLNRIQITNNSVQSTLIRPPEKQASIPKINNGGGISTSTA